MLTYMSGLNDEYLPCRCFFLFIIERPLLALTKLLRLLQQPGAGAFSPAPAPAKKSGSGSTTLQ